MPELDAEMMVDQVMMLGLVSREQLREATAEAEDASPDTVLRMLLRKGALTSWQVERLKKGDPSGFFFGDSKVCSISPRERSPECTAASIARPRQPWRSRSSASGLPRSARPSNGFTKRPRRAFVSASQHRPDHRCRAAGSSALHDHGIRRGNEPARLHEAAQPDPDRASGPAHAGNGPWAAVFARAGVTHRDIKGTNILISNAGEAKLVDFGLATIQSDETKPGVKSQRTVDYSALERTCKSPKGDPRSDIYFLGCVFYQMVTGQLPMEESESKDMLRKMLKRSFGAIKPINDHRYAPDEEICRIIEKMMKIDLKARYQNMEDVVADLERFEASVKPGTVRRRSASNQ